MKKSEWHSEQGTVIGMGKSDNVNHPSHYQGSYECIDLMREIYGDEAVRHFCICNAYKYRFRAGKKKGEEAQTAIEKAEWYERYVMEHFPANEVLQSERFLESIRKWNQWPEDEEV